MILACIPTPYTEFVKSLTDVPVLHNGYIFLHTIFSMYYKIMYTVLCVAVLTMSLQN